VKEAICGRNFSDIGKVNDTPTGGTRDNAKLRAKWRCSWGVNGYFGGALKGYVVASFVVLEGNFSILAEGDVFWRWPRGDAS
jgi:hypothetical protein